MALSNMHSADFLKDGSLPWKDLKYHNYNAHYFLNMSYVIYTNYMNCIKKINKPFKRKSMQFPTIIKNLIDSFHFYIFFICLVLMQLIIIV